jgi:predicted MPP superfamily phosphohydrolase
LGDPFDGYTIVVLSDFHHRHPFTDLRWLRHAVDSANAVSPDLVALLGDYASSFKQMPVVSRGWYARALPAMAGEVRRLSARDGVVAVLGNHDYYAMPRWYESGSAHLALMCLSTRRHVWSGPVARCASPDWTT